MAVKEYDFVLSSPFSNYDFFAHRMRELCGQLNHTFFPADEVWVTDFLKKLKKKEISVKVLLDLSNTQTDPKDPFLMLAEEASPVLARIRLMTAAEWYRSSFDLAFCSSWILRFRRACSMPTAA